MLRNLVVADTPTGAALVETPGETERTRDREKERVSDRENERQRERESE